ncbi:hypothetical protein ABZT06_12865 [Streptomyces sp. NPDC005483]|uniref:hypothetical protein n=1 Tax=Streptomyces sp. NPDC005483 TaxID=3154882 RepID=UPI0033A44D58
MALVSSYLSEAFCFPGLPVPGRACRVVEIPNVIKRCFSLHSIDVGNMALSAAHVMVCNQSGAVRNEGRVREETGDAMQKLKNVAAVAVMVGGLGLVGGGVANAHSGHGHDGDFPSAVDNLQVVSCDQELETGATFAPATGSEGVGGGSGENSGKFCTVIGSVEG